MSWLSALGDLLGADRYSAHSLCLANDPILMMMYTAGHLGTAISYTVIGLTLIIHRIRLIRMSPGAVSLYGTFILLCAANHFSHVATLFWGIYRLEIVVVLAMMSVSATTAALTAAAVYGQDQDQEQAS